MLILQDILSQEIVLRLGWTLLHFIWQAAAVALILTILLRLLWKSTANLRYIIACLALALIVLLPLITINLVPVSQPPAAANFAQPTVPTILPIAEMPAPETIVIAKPSQPEIVTLVPEIPFEQRVADTLEPALPYIVSGWLIGVFGLSIWHLGGWTQLQRLKRRMVKQVDSTLLNKLKMLTQKLKVKQNVKLMESALVQIPTVVGWLRPVILLPASALTGLNTEQLEAIIAHELAHIKRFDYLINIFQTVAEILGFYHPAVWWVSHKIRAERENCCDDIAVSISGDRVSYAGALASMEEIRAAGGKLAVAATGGNLFRRICRLLGKDSTDNTGLSWVPAATAILLIIALAIPTTLALTNKTDSMLTETTTDIQVEDDMLIATALDIESPTENIPPGPMLATSPAPFDTDQESVVKANLLVVEIPLNSTIDTETLKEAEKILGDKVSLRNSTVNIILRQASKATAATKDESAENKRVTEKQFNTLIKMLDSKGYLRILMNPTIETLSSKTATIRSAQQVPLQQIPKVLPGGFGQLTTTTPEIEYVDVVDLIEITPHVLADGQISLDVKADLGSPKLPDSEAQTTPVSSRKLSTHILANPGESIIIGGLINNSPIPGDNIKNALQQTNELIFIITPTIMKQPAKLKEITDTQIEKFKKELSSQNLKQLGLAVAMFADDHDEILPESIQKLKPYIRSEDTFSWILDNVEYFDRRKTTQRNAHSIPIAYDKTLIEKADGTNVLFLDFSVRFVESKEFEKLDINIIRNEFLIDARFLSVSEDFLQNLSRNADSQDEAKDLFKLKSELLTALDGSNKSSFILSERNVSLLLKAVRAHKDSQVLAAPQVICQEDKAADIRIANATHFISGYTEPNNPSDEPQPKFDRVEEGITMSLRPKLTPNKNIDMEFELEIIKISGFEEKTYKGKYPYKLPTVQSIDQATRYIAKNGQTLLFGGHKIADGKDNQAEQKDLLVLITAHTIGSSEQNKPVQAQAPIVAEPSSSTTNMMTPPAIAKSRIERPKDNEQDKTIPVTERRRRPASSIDESKPDEVITEIFEIRNGDPVEIVEILKKLINGRPDTASVIKPETASVIESSNGPILLIPEPKRKWIIAKASPENINQIGQWIKKLDTNKSTMGLDPIDEVVHKQLEMIVDLSELAPGMPFGEVVEILENSVEPPLQIQPIWKDLLDNAEVEQATPAGMDPLPHIKLRKALEILLTSVSSTGLPKLTYVVDEGVILIGTAEILPSKMLHQVDEASDLDETTADTPQSSQKEQEKTTSAIKADEMQIIRQQYINNDSIVKPVTERITKLENELIELRQQYTPSHPEIRIKASLLRALKNALQKREKEVGKAFDDIMAKETHQVNQDKVAELLDELREPNIPSTPTVPLISNTFIDYPLLDALQYIAAAANVTIIPDESIEGVVSCTLKDVTVETTLDIILAGTPYVWKKTPHYYLVASGGIELPEITARIESAKKLSNLGKALLIYANNHDDKYPVSLRQLPGYLNEDYKWALSSVIYMGNGKKLADRPDTILAYDHTLIPKGKGTNVLYNDFHVSFEKHENLIKLGIGREIIIETVFLSVSDDFLKDVGLDANPEEFSDAWREHLAATYPAVKNGKPYGLILDDLQVTFLLRAVQAHKDSKALVAPRVHTQEGTTADIGMTEEYRYIKGYNEPNSPSGEPQSKRDKVQLGPHIWLTPKMTDNNRNINLDFKLEINQLEGIIEGKYKEKYPIYKPIINVISANMPCTFPKGKTMLIGGLKINEPTIKKETGTGLGGLFKEPGMRGMGNLFKEPDTPQLKDLPFVGLAFSDKDKIKDPKMLLILVKPITDPHQKAAKLPPGQEDSEKEIQQLAEQLEKKINPPGKPM